MMLDVFAKQKRKATSKSVPRVRVYWKYVSGQEFVC